MIRPVAVVRRRRHECGPAILVAAVRGVDTLGQFPVRALQRIRSEANKLAQLGALLGLHEAAVLTQLQTCIYRGGNVIVPMDGLAAVVDLKPSTDLRPAPESIAGTRVGHGSRKSSRPAFIHDQQADTLAAPTRAGGNAGDGDKSCTGEPDHLDAGEAFDLSDSRQNCGFRIGSLPVKIQVLCAVCAADESVIAARSKKSIADCITL